MVYKLPDEPSTHSSHERLLEHNDPECGVAQPQYDKYPCRYNRHAYPSLRAASRRKPATGSKWNIWDWASRAAIRLLCVLAFRDSLFTEVLCHCSIPNLEDDPARADKQRVGWLASEFLRATAACGARMSHAQRVAKSPSVARYAPIETKPPDASKSAVATIGAKPAPSAAASWIPSDNPEYRSSGGNCAL
jgi:hypothetical protein